MRIFFALVACAAPLLWISCSKVDMEARHVVESQPVDGGVLLPADMSSSNSSTIDPGSDEAPENDPAPPDPATASQDTSPAASPGVDRVAARSDAPVSNIVERKSSASARAKGEINFDDLKFELPKDAPFRNEMLTDEIRGLDGTDVKLRGYILPSTLFSETNISQFVLVRDNQECCFGPGAALFDCVMVQMVDGKTTDFVTRPVTVEGRFVIDTETYRYPPGLSQTGATHMAVFRIESDAVQ